MVLIPVLLDYSTHWTCVATLQYALAMCSQHEHFIITCVKELEGHVQRGTKYTPVRAMLCLGGAPYTAWHGAHRSVLGGAPYIVMRHGVTMPALTANEAVSSGTDSWQHAQHKINVTLHSE